MQRKRIWSLTALALAVGMVSYDPATAQPPAQAAKQQKRKLILEEKKKADELAAKKKAEEDTKKKVVETTKPTEPVKAPEKLTHTGPVTTDAKVLAQRIDAAINAKLVTEKITASPTCTDAEFIRRVYLDLTGLIPPAEKVKAFLDSKETDKRAKLIDELLASANYGKHMSDVWMSLLVQRSSDNRRISFEPLREWLTAEFNKNTAWSEIVNQIMTATGTQEKAPAVTFYVANNTVDKMTDQVTKLFLGVSMQCAQCHDHRFEDWKQKEYWNLTQFFMKVSVGGLNGAAAKGVEPGVNETDRVNRKKSPLPEAAMTVPAKFLRDGGDIKLDPKSPARPTLAKWVTSKDNPYFAKAMINRTWSQFFGSGIVNPVDDMGPNEKASYPTILRDLADQFARGGYDLKNMIRAICNSQAYQRSSKTVAGNDKDEMYFSHMTVKIMTPEQLYDSTLSLVNVAASGPRGKMGLAGGKAGGQDGREKFVNFFLAGAEMASTTEYEVGIPQALKLMNSRISGNVAAVKAITGDKPTNTEAIEKLYLAALARKPSKAETDRMVEFVSKAPTAMDGYSDVLWALLNSSEYTMVR